MNVDKMAGNKELTLLCRGFRNPILRKIITGFAIYMYDSEFFND